MWRLIRIFNGPAYPHCLMSHIGKLIDFSFFLPKLKLLLLKAIVLFSMELEDLNFTLLICQRSVSSFEKLPKFLEP
jgi:hypothetical protein